MSSVRFISATKVYPGASKPAIDNLTLSVNNGEFMVLAGATGCGKSTLLRILAGLEELDSGSVLLNGRDVTNLPPRDRDTAIVFQNYALYPHMTVAENMVFPLKIAGVPKEERLGRIQEAAALLELQEHLGAYPDTLSGELRQRIAIGRAIMRKPQVFLVDEPMSNLNAELRASTARQISALARKLNTTTIYVAQESSDLLLGDRIAFLEQGRLQRVCTPAELPAEAGAA